MQVLLGKRILLGITGGIAAYKSPDLVRRLRDLGADVRVVMTSAACEFITPLTLQAVSGSRVYTELLDTEAEAAMGHIELARWGDAIVIAPATADSLARFAAGRADDLLGTLLRASEAPVLIAPAMNQAMWRDAANQTNYAALISQGYASIGPDAGSQACGDVGLGRMSEPLAIAGAVVSLFESDKLHGRHVIITAGPTREALDPVRYLSNHSSGKMGFALARAAQEAGAKVTLISGPVALATPPRVDRIDVDSAADMLAASLEAVKSADIFIASAAVADFRPIRVAAEKIKKSPERENITLELIKNPDILHTVAQLPDKPFVVGFAAETSDPVAHAKQKLERKNLDMIVANDVSRNDIGFSSEDNEATVLMRDSTASKGDAAVQIALEKMSKVLLAQKLIALMASQLSAR